VPKPKPGSGTIYYIQAGNALGLPYSLRDPHGAQLYIAAASKTAAFRSLPVNREQSWAKLEHQNRINPMLDMQQSRPTLKLLNKVACATVNFPSSN